MFIRFLQVVGLLFSLTACAHTRADDLSDADRTFFEAKVRPILVERCYECHSAQAKTLRGGLLLDSMPGWQTGGDTGPALVPGDPDESLLIQAVRYDDPILKMPPKGKLGDDEVAILTEWIQRGAPDPRTTPTGTRSAAVQTINVEAAREHWAFQPLKHVEPPEVRNAAWCRTPIDRFIMAKLEEHGLEPNPEPEPHVLHRRLSFDLTGLPPKPEQARSFENDPTSAAYDQIVDGLLQNERFGERWARHWLDLARFAESHGFEHDYDRPYAYVYRDFVIEAFNADLPFDTFVKWQIAGDEFAPDNVLAMKATGFLGAGTHSTQITKNQVEKERYDELDDMLSTTGTAFLGLTIGCARCHDHKYDPIATEDYYRLLATFTTTVRSEVNLVPDREAFARARAKYEAEHRPYQEALARFEATELPARFAAWELSRSRSTQGMPRWVVLEPSKFESKGGATHALQPDRSLKIEGTNPDFDVYRIEAACDLAEITGIRIEALADESLPHAGPGRAPNGNFALTHVDLSIGPRYGIGASRAVSLINAKASFEQSGLPASAAVDQDPKSGWAVDPQFGVDHALVLEIGENVRTDSGCTLVLSLAFENNAGHNIGRLRVSVTDSPRPVGLNDDGVPASIRALLECAPESRVPEHREALLNWYKTIDTAWRALKQSADDHAKTAPKEAGEKALVCSEGLPPLRLHTQGDDFLPQTHLLRRGDPNQKERVVEPGFLPVLTRADESRWKQPPPPDWRTSYRRRALAEWITDPEHGAGHLLARVIVNRLWQHHFGRGIVATPSDFGKQGTPPTHPELLDWLARQLIEGGWKLKPIHRLIVTSAVYRQGSQLDRHKAARDVENRWWWRYERRRLEGEAIRDAMLDVSGLLDTRMYGPGSLDERMRRRSIYFTVKRSQLIPMMSLYDGPDALTPLPARARTTVAPQTLLLMNNPVVREWAEAFAVRVRELPDDGWTPTIDRAYRLALSRPPRSEELAAAERFLERQRQSHAQAADPTRAALTDFCQVLLSTNEFIFIE